MHLDLDVQNNFTLDRNLIWWLHKFIPTVISHDIPGRYENNNSSFTLLLSKINITGIWYRKNISVFGKYLLFLHYKIDM